MTNVFPHLITFGFIAPLLLRITLGVALLSIGKQLLTQKRIAITAYFETQQYPVASWLGIGIGSAAILTGIFCVIGFFTQIACLIAIYILLNIMFIEYRDDKVFAYSQVFYLIMMVIASSLIFSGAGTWSLDALV